MAGQEAWQTTAAPPIIPVACTDCTWALMPQVRGTQSEGYAKFVAVPHFTICRATIWCCSLP